MGLFTGINLDRLLTRNGQKQRFYVNRSFIERRLLYKSRDFPARTTILVRPKDSQTGLPIGNQQANQ